MDEQLPPQPTIWDQFLGVGRVRKSIAIGLMIAAAPIGMILGELSMLLIYFCVFLPIGILFRLLRRDTLQLRMNRNQETYWQSKTDPQELASYYRRF